MNALVVVITLLLSRFWTKCMMIYQNFICLKFSIFQPITRVEFQDSLTRMTGVKNVLLLTRFIQNEYIYSFAALTKKLKSDKQHL